MILEEFITKNLDKIAHFSLAGLITGAFTIIAMLQEGICNTPIVMVTPLIGTVPVVLFAWFKEAVIDNNFDTKDFIASVLGCVSIFLVTAVGYFLHYLSN